MSGVKQRLQPAVVFAIALPLLLAVVVAGIAITARVRGDDAVAPPVAETGPLALAPVDAPDAGSGSCTTLLDALPATLDGGRATRPLAAPAPPASRAWAAVPRPVVLRCGLPRPAELTPTSALLAVNGVSWLRLDDGVPDPVVITYVAVDRPVYVVLTVPVDAGSAPLQQISDVVRDKLPTTAVAVR
ncbi:DUF3515 domain-containing protein [Pseudonocardia sp. GCM10023141]|uniref:DUF3515 domain-containing protein n=1 Tax=Pseudonocardia sp. GCM10023141 TaxID=3252653 RepID=UPI0036093B38